MQKLFFPSLLALSLSLILPVESARADSTTTISSDTSGNTYTVGPNNTFTVNSGKTLSYSSNGAIITVDNSGSGTTLIANNGTISNTSTGSNARDIQINPSSGSPNVSITNGSSSNSAAIIQTVGSDVIHAKSTSTSSNVSIYNYGTINAKNTGASSNNGQQAVDFNNQTAGSLLIDNYNTGIIEAYESDPIQVPLGGTITINNDGLIQGTRASGTTGTVDGINGETTSGQTINNAYGIDGESVTDAEIIGAHHGITADGSAASSSSPWTMTITNGAKGTITGNDGSGVNIDGINGYENVSVTNSGLIQGNGVSGDGDGVDVDGNVTLVNTGTIISKNAFASTGIAFSESVTVGGGTITNGSSANSTALIEGDNQAGHSNSVGRGITLAGPDQDSSGTAMPLVSIFEDSSITNYGTITGQSESGIAVLGTTGGGHAVTITNNATGNINGNNTGVSERANVTYNKVTSPNGQSLNQGAIELDDTGNTYEVDNYGTITQSGASGVAVAMHSASNNALNVFGGAINGDVTGDTAADSTLTFETGSNPAFSFSHNISNFAVKVTSGTTELTGTVGNTGATMVSGGKLNITGSMIHSATTVSGGKLLGDGTAGAVTVNSGGSVQAGTLADAALTGIAATHLASTQAASTNFKFSLTGLTLDGGSTLVFDLAHTAAGTGTGTTSAPAGGTMFDLGLTGLLGAGANVTAGSITLDFDGSAVGGTPTANNVYELAAFALGTPNIAIADYKIQNLAVDGGGLATLSYTMVNGQEVLDLTVAPEPGTWAMLAGGMGLLASFGRWRKLSI